MLQTQPQPILATDLATEISRYSGQPYRFLTWLMLHPSDPQSEGMRTIGSAEATLYSWRRDIAGFSDTVERVRSYNTMLRTEYARAAMLAAVPDAVDTLIAVATDPKARDGQRARERILEETGVLQRQGQPADDGTARATLALLVGALQQAQGRQRQPEAQRTVIDVPEIGSTT